MRKRNYLLIAVLSSMLVLSSCRNDSTSESSGDVSSSIVNATKITLKATKSELKVGESLELSYELEPNGATTNRVVFSSSNEEVATVSNTGLLLAKKEGSVTITIKVEGLDVSDSLDFTIILDKDAIGNQLTSLLKETLRKERDNANGGSVNSQIAFRVYKNSLQIDYDENSKVRYYLTGNTLTALTLSSSSVTEENIGTLDEDLTQSQIDDYTKLFSYTYRKQPVFGISSLLSSALNDSYFFASEASKENLVYSIVDENGSTTYSLTTSYIDASVSYDKKYYENEFSFTLNENKELINGSYSIHPFNSFSYDFDKKEKKEGATPINPEEFSFQIEYGERSESDSSMLDRSSYLVQRYDVDTSSFRNKGEGEALLYVGDRVPLEVTNVEPKIHLVDTYSVSSISDSSVLTYETNGNVTYLKALAKGTATVKVESSYLKEASITVKVIDVPPSKIEIGVTSLKEIEVGQKANYIVSVSPFDAKDRSFSAEFENEAMKEFATLTLNADGSSFSLEGKKAGTVKVIVKTTADPSIVDSIEVTIKAKETVDPQEDLAQYMAGKTYTGKYVVSLTVKFIDKETATLAIANGSEYSFNWSLGTKGDTVTTILIPVESVKLTKEVSGSKGTFDGTTSSDRIFTVTNDGKTIKFPFKYNGNLMTATLTINQ